jgi:hypothetical protein
MFQVKEKRASGVENKNGLVPGFSNSEFISDLGLRISNFSQEVAAWPAGLWSLARILGVR